MNCLLCPEMILADIALPPRLSRAGEITRHTDHDTVPAQTPADHWLSQRFGVPTGSPIDAWAAVNASSDAARLTDSNGKEGPTRYTVTPAHLHAAMDHLVLYPPAQITITHQEAARLSSAANDFCAQDGFQLEVLSPACWQLTLPQPLALTLHGSGVASGRNIDAYMPGGADGRRLRALLNEIQMLWHDHPVNEARDNAGLPRINTLWVEGVASALRKVTDFDGLISGRSADRGLALAAGIPPERIAAIDIADHQRQGTVASQEVGGHPADHAIDEQLDAIISRLPALGNQCLVVLPQGMTPIQLEGLLTRVAARPARLVLTDNRSWIELVVTPADRYKVWRQLRWPA